MLAADESGLTTDTCYKREEKSPRSINTWKLFIQSYRAEIRYNRIRYCRRPGKNVYARVFIKPDIGVGVNKLAGTLTLVRAG